MTASPNEVWGISTDFSGAFFLETRLDTILYSHVMAHKENSSPPVERLRIATNEFVSGEILIQFEMPDPDALAEACGLVINKREK